MINLQVFDIVINKKTKELALIVQVSSTKDHTAYSIDYFKSPHQGHNAWFSEAELEFVGNIEEVIGRNLGNTSTTDTVNPKLVR